MEPPVTRGDGPQERGGATGYNSLRVPRDTSAPSDGLSAANSESTISGASVSGDGTSSDELEMPPAVRIAAHQRQAHIPDCVMLNKCGRAKQEDCRSQIDRSACFVLYGRFCNCSDESAYPVRNNVETIRCHFQRILRLIVSLVDPCVFRLVADKTLYSVQAMFG